MPAPRSTVRRPGPLAENRRPVGIDVIVNVIGTVEDKGIHPFGLERVGDEGGPLGGGSKEDERDARVTIRVVTTAELDASLTRDAGDAVRDLSLALSHVVQQLVQTAQLNEGHCSLQLRHAEIDPGQDLL